MIWKKKQEPPLKTEGLHLLLRRRIHAVKERLRIGIHAY
jgi:hypothetical protein